VIWRAERWRAEERESGARAGSKYLERDSRRAEERESGRVGVGEWESGRAGEWESRRAGEHEN
jgi:hypothetical protein